MKSTTIMKTTAALMLSFCTLASPLCAGPAKPETVQKIENYLNGIKSYRATIHQSSDSGEKRTGHIYMLRDGKKSYGKLRLEYSPPAGDLIIANGESCKLYDHQTKETQDFNVEDTPASFLLARHIDLKNNLKVVDETTDSQGNLKLKIVKSGDESGSFLTLKFSTAPLLKMNGWTVLDPQGITQEIHLEDVNIGIDLDPKLFQFR